MPTTSKVLINEKLVSFEAYNIGGNNYIKLRDLAFAFTGTKTQFKVEWDSATNSILISTETVLANAAIKRTALINSKTEVSLTGKSYYVSYTGNDKNNGLTPATPWASLSKVNDAPLQAGDGVFFERGSIFRGSLQCKAGVTYSAYGSGPKPVLTESPENGAGEEKWTLLQQGSKGVKIWKYHRDMNDCGNFVIENNYVLFSGDCWSIPQHNYETMPYSICFGDTNLYNDGIYVRNNVFYASTLSHIWGNTKEEYLPIFKNNYFYLQDVKKAVAVWNLSGSNDNNFTWYWYNDYNGFLNTKLGNNNKVYLIKN